jgi:hypothetical protein
VEVLDHIGFWMNADGHWHRDDERWPFREIRFVQVALLGGRIRLAGETRLDAREEESRRGFSHRLVFLGE